MSVRVTPCVISSLNDQAYLRIKHGIPDGQFPIAYLDYNNDAYMDIITYSKENNTGNFTFSAFVYDTTNKNFQTKETLFELLLSESSVITNVFGGSLQPQQPISFIVSVYDAGQPKSFLFMKNSENNKYEQTHSFVNTNIVIGDFDGDRHVEILYNDEEGARKIYSVGKEGVKGFSELFIFESQGSETDFSNRKILNYGNAMIDIDSDCRNDVLITGEPRQGGIELEIWRGVLDNNCMLQYRISNVTNSIISLTEKSYGAFVLGDFNNDGFVDILFPIHATNKVQVYLNKHTPKHDWADNYCETHKITSGADQMLFTKPITFELSDVTEIYAAPNTNSYIRLGDLKNEAFPGFILVNKINDSNYTVNIYHNNKNDCKDSGKDDCLPFSFKLGAMFTQEQHLKGTPLYASYFDINEDGSLDIVIATANGIDCYFNNYVYDTFFLKGETMLETKNFASLEIGVNYRYIVTNNSGDRLNQVSFQLAQTGNMALNLPYSLVGIGRSNNYIENYSVISNSIRQSSCITEEKTFTPIIPKSQLLISKTLTEKEVVWNVDLIVSPTENIILLVIVIGVVLFVILVIIIILHLREIKEDKQQESEKFTAWFA